MNLLDMPGYGDPATWPPGVTLDHPPAAPDRRLISYDNNRDALCILPERIYDQVATFNAEINRLAQEADARPTPDALMRVAIAQEMLGKALNRAINAAITGGAPC